MIKIVAKLVETYYKLDLKLKFGRNSGLDRGNKIVQSRLSNLVIIRAREGFQFFFNKFRWVSPLGPAILSPRSDILGLK